MRAIAYIRVSTEEQATEGYSLAAQEAKIRAYAGLYGLEIVAVVSDAGLSAKNLNRPGLQSALERIAAGEAGALVIFKLDRLTRSVADWNLLIERYFAKDVALMSVSDQIDTRTAAGRLVLNVLVSVAQWEREANGERVEIGLAQKKAQGGHVGGIAYGYRRQNGQTLIADEAEEQTVVAIRGLSRKGWSLRKIADHLNREDVPTKRGKEWGAPQVKRVLDRIA